MIGRAPADRDTEKAIPIGMASMGPAGVVRAGYIKRFLVTWSLGWVVCPMCTCPLSGLKDAWCHALN